MGFEIAVATAGVGAAATAGAGAGAGVAAPGFVDKVDDASTAFVFWKVRSFAPAC
jgi:hypothetical protein